MIEFHPKRGNVATFVVGGEVTREEYDRVRPRFRSFVEEHGNVRLLLEVRDLKDVGIRAVLEDLELTTEHLRDFDRVALVSDADWHHTMADAFGAVTPGDVATFERSDRAEAEEWLEA